MSVSVCFTQLETLRYPVAAAFSFGRDKEVSVDICGVCDYITEGVFELR